MADKTVVVKILATVADYRAKLGSAVAATDAFVQSIDKNSNRLNTLGSSATKAGLVTAAGVGLVAKAAIDWESAWAGVTKTVDGSTEELATLQGQLREMARTMPATHSEIAAVAEAAGQLGVQTKSVAGFTKVMIDLGNTTNLSADEVATSLAQLMNVMGTSAGDVERLGSALVDLGNKGASTERDIVEMAQRIAAAGASVGLSEQDVLGFASALSSVGVNAEAGGTAISRSFKQIDSAVRAGGRSLEIIARTAGMTAAEYQQAWGQDAAGATEKFISGLGDVQRSGGDANAILKQLGMTGLLQTDSLLRLASANDLLAQNLQTSAQAWDENSALAQEAGKRYQTTESQVKIAWNNIVDAAIDAGAVILPIVAQVAQGITAVTDAYRSAPDAAKGFITAGAAVAAGALLAVGAITKIVTTAAEAQGALKALGISAKTAAIATAGIGGAIGIAALAWTTYAQGQAESKARVEQLADAIRGQTSVINENSRAVMIKALQDKGAYDAAKTLGISYGDVTLAAFGNAEAMARVNAQTQAAVQGYYQQNTAMDEAAAANNDYTRAQDILTGAIGSGNSELGRAKELAGQTAEANSALDAAVQGTADSVAAQAAELQKDNEELARAASLALQASGSMIGLESAIDAATAAAKENGRTLDINTEKGRANRSALDSIASAALAVRDSQEKTNASTEEMNASTERARSAFIRTAQQMGATKQQAIDLANKYNLIPRKVETTVTAKMQVPDVGAYMRSIQRRMNANPLYVPSRLPVSAYRAYGGPLPGYAASDRADNTLYVGTPGEWVIQRPTTRYYGSSIMAAVNEGRVPKSVLAPYAYAYGGEVGRRFSSLPRYAGGGEVMPQRLTLADTSGIEVAVARGVRAGLDGARLDLGNLNRIADYMAGVVNTSRKRG